MKWPRYKIDIRIATFAAVLVLAAAIAVVIFSRFAGTPTETSLAVSPGVEMAIQNLLTQYHIDEKSIKIRKVPSIDGKFIRIERRISVPEDFNTLNFNRDLSQAVTALGARAIATEKSEDKTVTMHVKKNDLILQSIVFVVQK